LTFAAVTDSNDCYQVPPVPLPTLSYDGGADETHLEFLDPDLIDFCTWRHVGICDSFPASSRLRASWIPEGGGPPAFEDRLPTTNSVLVPTEDGFTVLTGAVDDSIGGWIGYAGDTEVVWSDSILVSVGYRVSPAAVPLESLSLCDTAVDSLPRIDKGSAWITPERPFSFGVPASSLMAGKSLIVDVSSAWSVNGNEAVEILEWIGSLDEVTGAETGGATTGPRLDLVSFPNPMRDFAEIRYSLGGAARVTLEIFDLAGRRVRALETNASKTAGEHVASWDCRTADGSRVAPGVYVCRLSVGDREEARKLVVVR
jgi:hypothetical protein